MTATTTSSTAAERVRSVCATAAHATLALEGVPTAVTTLHRFRETGDTGEVVLVVTGDSPVAALTRRAGLGGRGAVLELTDTAAVALREPVRALVWLRGVLQPVHDQRTLALELAEEHAHPELLGIGHGSVLLRLEVASAVVADSTGAEPVSAADLLAASPDPFCAEEAAWLQHLEGTHADLLALLARRLPVELRRGRTRPLGLDRHGLALRVEREHGLGDRDVRLPFPTPVHDAAGLGRALRVLAGCPFLDGLHARTT